MLKILQFLEENYPIKVDCLCTSLHIKTTSWLQFVTVVASSENNSISLLLSQDEYHGTMILLKMFRSRKRIPKTLAQQIKC